MYIYIPYMYRGDGRTGRERTITRGPAARRGCVFSSLVLSPPPPSSPLPALRFGRFIPPFLFRAFLLRGRWRFLRGRPFFSIRPVDYKSHLPRRPRDKIRRGTNSTIQENVSSSTVSNHIALMRKEKALWFLRVLFRERRKISPSILCSERNLSKATSTSSRASDNFPEAHPPSPSTSSPSKITARNRSRSISCN